ncbi:hypothetical protein F2Q70_00039714 [Brassica cretica]|uniref:ABC transporter domain-containing protein n=1 Tax=Brassica cretica TaxID=69181 RepID=A0A8S9K194_BRACR|nr:hypothetical protein F2Q70_00039714 [Brassica cretica]
MIDACRRASPKTITAVIPLAMLELIERQVLYACTIRICLGINLLPTLSFSYDPSVLHILGGVARARAFVKKLSDAPLALVDKRRHGHNVAEVHAVMGKNGSGKSTFSKVLVGHPDYEVTGGSIVF